MTVGELPAARAELRLGADATAIGRVRKAVRAFATAHGAPAGVVADLALAATEAATNAVLHAYVDREPGTLTVVVSAEPDRLLVTVADDGRGMQPRPDSPGLGMGLPLIGQLSSQLEVNAVPGGGTQLVMAFAAPGVRGDGPGGAAAEQEHAELLGAVSRLADGAWPGEGVERLADLLVPALADACAVDALDADGRPQRFAGRIGGPEAARRSAWLAGLRPRVDVPGSAAGLALREESVQVTELTPEHVARVTQTPEDAAEMAATGIRWWAVAPLRRDGRVLGLLHLGTTAERGRPDPGLLELLGAVAERAGGALATGRLVGELRRTRRRFEAILDGLEEAVLVRDESGAVRYANRAAGVLLGEETPEALPAEQVERRLEEAGAEPAVEEPLDDDERLRLTILRAVADPAA